MLSKVLVFSGCSALLALGCARHHSSANSAPTAAVSPRAETVHHLTQCGSAEKSYESRADLNQNVPVQVSIERDFQNVIHQDCRGAVTSSGIETVKSPTIDIDFKPNQLPAPVGAVQIFNDTACDWSTNNFGTQDGITNRWLSRHIDRDFGRVTGDTHGNLHITLDASKGGSTFHVKPGPNVIYYTYYDTCVPDNERHGFQFGQSCPSALEISSGTFLINVNYSEQTLPGDHIDREETCSTR